MKMMFGGLSGAGSAAKDGRVAVETASRRPANADPMLRACPEIGDLHAVSGKALAAGIVLATFRHVSPAASASRLTISGHALRKPEVIVSIISALPFSLFG